MSTFCLCGNLDDAIRFDCVGCFSILFNNDDQGVNPWSEILHNVCICGANLILCHILNNQNTYKNFLFEFKGTLVKPTDPRAGIPCCSTDILKKCRKIQSHLPYILKYEFNNVSNINTFDVDSMNNTFDLVMAIYLVICHSNDSSNKYYDDPSDKQTLLDKYATCIKIMIERVNPNSLDLHKLLTIYNHFSLLDRSYNVVPWREDRDDANDINYDNVDTILAEYELLVDNPVFLPLTLMIKKCNYRIIQCMNYVISHKMHREFYLMLHYAYLSILSDTLTWSNFIQAITNAQDILIILAFLSYFPDAAISKLFYITLVNNGCINSLKLIHNKYSFGSKPWLITDKNNNNVFHCISNTVNTLKYLVTLFDDVSLSKYLVEENKFKYTPIMTACLNLCPEYLSILFDTGKIPPSAFLKNSSGKSVLTIAIEKSHNDSTKEKSELCQKIILKEMTNIMSDKESTDYAQLIEEKKICIQKSYISGLWPKTISIDMDYSEAIKPENIISVLNVIKAGVNDGELKKLRHFSLQFKNTRGNGPSAAFFEVACKMFASRSDKLAVMLDSDNNLYIPYHHNVTSDDIAFMEHLGLLLSIASVFSVNLPLSRPFYEALIDLNRYFDTLTVDYFLPESTLKYLRSDDVDSLDLTMTIRTVDAVGVTKEFDLVENGSDISVTADNIDTYIKLVDDFYKNRGGRDVLMRAFCRGFNIYGSLDNFFGYINSFELNAMLNVSYKITPEIYIANIDIQYDYSVNIHIAWLCQYVTKLSVAMFDKFIEFVCGTNIVNKNSLVSFGGRTKFLVNVYKIGQSQYNDKTLFTIPYTTTCYKQINIPECNNQEEFNQKMDIALDNYAYCNDFQLE